MRVGQPKTPWHLPTNYRTHSGILGAAAAVVDVLREQFSQVSWCSTAVIQRCNSAAKSQLSTMLRGCTLASTLFAFARLMPFDCPQTCLDGLS